MICDWTERNGRGLIPMGMTAVFGSVFVDVKGFSFNKYIPEGRNVGDVKIVHGGVCRNVAENLANIGCGVSLVSMFENNAIGDDVRRRLAAKHVDLRYARSVPAGMGMWLAVMDENGNLAGSISRQPDFAAMCEIVETQGDEIMQACDSVVIEVDMRADIADKVFELAQKHRRDVYVVVGNMSVILKKQELLPKARMFILNEIEAGALFGCTLEQDKPMEVLEIMKSEALQRGIREIVVTLGPHGAVFFDAQSGDCGHIPAEEARLVDSTGAGDAFFSGTIAARMRGFSLKDAAFRGAHLAALTIQSEESTCPRINNFLEV